MTKDEQWVTADRTEPHYFRLFKRILKWSGIGLIIFLIVSNIFVFGALFTLKITPSDQPEFNADAENIYLNYSIYVEHNSALSVFDFTEVQLSLDFYNIEGGLILGVETPIYIIPAGETTNLSISITYPISDPEAILELLETDLGSLRILASLKYAYYSLALSMEVNLEDMGEM